MKRIYLDYNATTPLKPQVYEAMVPYFKELYGNPSSIHWAGQAGKEALMVAREKVANLFHVDPQEVVFTSGGTEANNLALKGVFGVFQKKWQKKGRHIITTQVEHKSILECCDYLKKQGAEISYISVHPNGQIHLEELKAQIRPDTILISVQAANNETGVLMPLKEISDIAQAHNILFHVDAVQMAGKKALFLDELPMDLVSISSHKIYGPKGAGALIIRRALKLEALLHGGNQERKRRGGTENVPAIVGFGTACEWAQKESASEAQRLEELRNKLEEGIFATIPEAVIHGKDSPRVSNTLNVSFKGLEAEGLLLNLDLKGIATSSGSACSSGSLDPSHVLLAMGVSPENALSSIRFSLGYQTQKEDIEFVLEVLPEMVQRLRSLNEACR